MRSDVRICAVMGVAFLWCRAGLPRSGSACRSTITAETPDARRSGGRIRDRPCGLVLATPSGIGRATDGRGRVREYARAMNVAGSTRLLYAIDAVVATVLAVWWLAEVR